MTHPHFPAATLQIARDGFKNHIASIHAMTVTEDPCAWGHARLLCQELAEYAKTVEIELAHYYQCLPSAGQQALRLVAESEWIATPEEEEAFQEMESRTAHLCPVFAPQVAL